MRRVREMCFVLEQNGFQPRRNRDYDNAVNKLNEPGGSHPS